MDEIFQTGVPAFSSDGPGVSCNGTFSSATDWSLANFLHTKKRNKFVLHLLIKLQGLLVTQCFVDGNGGQEPRWQDCPELIQQLWHMVQLNLRKSFFIKLFVDDKNSFCTVP